eukprot:1764376-Prymnesium_polylepis.1
MADSPEVEHEAGAICVCGAKRRGEIIGAYDAKSSHARLPYAAKSKTPRGIPYVAKALKADTP